MVGVGVVVVMMKHGAGVYMRGAAAPPITNGMKGRDAEVALL